MLHEFLIRNLSSFVGIFEFGEVARKGRGLRSENSEVESLEVEFEENVSNIVKKGHGLWVLERIKLAASLAAEGREY